MKIEFIPENLRDEEIFQYITELLDKVVEKDNEIAQPLLSKLDPSNTEDIEEVYKEFGVDYIIDMLKTEETKEILSAYFSLIRAYKGKRSGLELLFNLLGWKFEIKEWWEEPERLPCCTAEVSLYVDPSNVNTQPGKTPMSQILWFMRNYVYPLIYLVWVVNLGSIDTDILTAGFFTNKVKQDGFATSSSIILTSAFFKKKIQAPIISQDPGAIVGATKVGEFYIGKYYLNS